MDNNELKLVYDFFKEHDELVEMKQKQKALLKVVWAAELKDAKTTSKRRLAVQRQLITLDEKLYRLDAKRAKAYYVAVEGRAC